MVKTILLVTFGAMLCHAGNIYGDAIVRHAMFLSGYVHISGIPIDHPAPPDGVQAGVQ